MTIPLIVAHELRGIVVGVTYSHSEREPPTITGIYLGRNKEEVDRLVLLDINADYAARTHAFNKLYKTIDEWRKDWNSISYLEG